MQFKGVPRLILPDGRVVSVDRSPFIVGQYENFCQLAIDDDDIAPVHLQLEFDNERWFVRDMKSKTGVTINQNDVPYGGFVPIEHGDCVTMGNYVMTFVVRPDALVTEDEMGQINDDYAKLLSLENQSKREDVLGLIELLWRKIEAVAPFGGFESGIDAVRAAKPSAFYTRTDKLGEKQHPHDGQTTLRHDIETIGPNVDKGHREAVSIRPDNKIGGSSLDGIRPQAVTDGDRSLSFSGSEPVFPEAASFDLSERIMTPPPDIGQSTDALPVVPDFDLRARAIGGHDAKAAAAHPMPAASVETQDTSSAGLRLMPDDSTLNPMVVDHFPFSIGKRNHCNYVLKKSDVSRFHAVLTTDGDAVYLMDKGSTNGTFVGDDRLTPEEPMKLDNGDHVTFAGYGFTVFV